MSAKGSSAVTAVLQCPDLRVVVVAASWHDRVVSGLVGGATRALDSHGVPAARIVRVPGSFELPVVCAALAKASYDAIVALGVVIRGGTPHFDYVCSAATDGLARVALDSGVPVGFGLLTCDSEMQALDRAGLPGSSEDKGYDAASAAVVTACTLRSVLAGGSGTSPRPSARAVPAEPTSRRAAP